MALGQALCVTEFTGFLVGLQVFSWVSWCAIGPVVLANVSKVYTLQ